MTKYEITSKAGVFFGVYEGADERAAFMSMLAETGAESQYGEPSVGTEEDWIIRPAPVLTDDVRARLEWDLEEIAGSTDLRDVQAKSLIRKALDGDVESLAQYLSL
jgi:hypothetical protein